MITICDVCGAKVDTDTIVLRLDQPDCTSRNADLHYKDIDVCSLCILALKDFDIDRFQKEVIEHVLRVRGAVPATVAGEQTQTQGTTESEQG